MGSFTQDNPRGEPTVHTAATLGLGQSGSFIEHAGILYIDSPQELDEHFISSIRNAPIEIRFTNNYWEAN
jgi:hypothetical protein